MDPLVPYSHLARWTDVHGANAHVADPAAPRAAHAERRAAPPAGPPAETGAALTLDDVLTPEERAFFADRAALGPLTYGPGRNVTPGDAAPTGGRVDLIA
jgi:hypothetical protein